jgi:cytochrome P450
LLLSGKDNETLSNEELSNNIITMIVASYETTQVSLAAVLYYLAKFPEWQHSLREEVNSIYDNNRQDDYETWTSFFSMGNFILESLRCNSPLANQNARITSEDTELGGYFVKKGTLVNLNIHGAHMNPTDLTNPKQFDPARFDKEALAESPDSFLPFGAGPRVCLGKHFTITEQKMVVSALLRKFEIGLNSPDQAIPTLRGSFTGLPHINFELVFTRLK